MKEAIVSQKKKNTVSELVNEINRYKIIGIVDLINVPSLQLQRMRAALKGKVKIIMCKGRLIKIALKQAKKDEVCEYVKGMPALILTNENPFALAKILKKSKSAAPAKSGQTAPNNITVSAGPTAFSPGPIIGELGSLGIKTGIENGKVAVKQDTIIVKEGEIIKPAVASLLARLGIEPMEIGLNIIGVYENGVIFTKKTLDIDEKQFMSDLISCARNAYNLAFSVAYPTKDNIKLLIKKAQLDAIALADSQDILTSESVKRKIAQATLEVKNIANKGHIDITEAEVHPAEHFRKEEEVAQDVLKRLQENKIKTNKT